MLSAVRGFLRGLLGFKCKYAGKCRLYREDSSVCVGGGGSYCGEYRRILRQNVDK